MIAYSASIDADCRKWSENKMGSDQLGFRPNRRIKHMFVLFTAPPKELELRYRA